MQQLLAPEPETLDFDYDQTEGCQVAYLRGYRILAKQDSDAQNPFEDWDGHWPMVALYDGDLKTYDKVDGASGNPLWRFNDYQLILMQKHLAAIIGWTEHTWMTDADELRENMEPWFAEGPYERTLDEWAKVYDLLDIPNLRHVSRGYCQGDWASLLIVATPEAIEKNRGKDWAPTPEERAEVLKADMEGQAKLYDAWAWGDVYGYIIEQPCEWDDDGEPNEWEDIDGMGSCWGYYGTDHDESGLAEAALAEVPDKPAPSPPFDMVLSPGHGYYDLAAVTPAGQALVDEVAAAKRTDIGTDDAGTSILLDGFFGAAGDWCKDHALPRGLRVKWGETIYAGGEGIAALNEECM